MIRPIPAALPRSTDWYFGLLEPSPSKPFRAKMPAPQPSPKSPSARNWSWLEFWPTKTESTTVVGNLQ
jgi:hypothetical protein